MCNCLSKIRSCTGISEGSVQLILKKLLDLRKVCARWVPHLLTEEQKTQCLKCARELLKTYKGCNSRVISNLLTDDETWVHMFKPQRRADNKQWKQKDKKTPMYCQENPQVRKRSCTQFSLIQVGQLFKCLVLLVIQSLADYKNSVLKKVKGFYNKKRPSKGWSGVHLLHDNASDAVIYTDQFTCYIGTWTRKLKFIAILNAALGLI